MIEDQGVGFDAATLFKRSKPVNGGFGLFDVRERLSLVDGEIEIESSTGKGSRVTIRVPLGGHPNRAEEQGQTATHGPAPITRNNLHRDGAIRLLLVDDHAVVRQGIRSALSAEEDLEIVGEAEDGEKAVEWARKLEPDVILMDFSMPKLDGVQATRVIHEELPDITIIGLSFYEEEDRTVAMIDAGATLYLSKAGTCEALVCAIRKNSLESHARRSNARMPGAIPVRIGGANDN